MNYSLTGPSAGFIGEAELSGAFISPFILMIFTGLLVALDCMVTDLFIKPILLVSYLTFNSPVFPGAIGSLGHEGTVHPHEPLAFEITKSSEPVLVKTKTHSPFACCCMVP